MPQSFLCLSAWHMEPFKISGRVAETASARYDTAAYRGEPGIAGYRRPAAD